MSKKTEAVALAEAIGVSSAIRSITKTTIRNVLIKILEAINDEIALSTANNTNTTNSGKVLDARQGQILNGLILRRVIRANSPFGNQDTNDYFATKAQLEACMSYGIALTGMELYSCSLTYINFIGNSGGSFYISNLSYCFFKNSFDMIFHECNLLGAYFDGGKYYLYGSGIQSAVFRDCDFTSTNFQGCTLDSLTRFESCNLTSADFQYLNFPYGSNMSTMMYGCVLNETNFYGVTGMNANISVALPLNDNGPSDSWIKVRWTDNQAYRKVDNAWVLGWF
jgi:uncharacterized protein YjbI with pentapeptide repeats